ncbi:MAG: hypothetical protein ABFD04_07430 [Syntrophomonas sp.]
MQRLLVIVLISIILGMMLPIYTQCLNSQPAFTPDNLIRLNTSYR